MTQYSLIASYHQKNLNLVKFSEQDSFSEINGNFDTANGR